MPIATGFIRILSALILSIPVFLCFAYYLGALALEDTILEPRYVANSFDDNDVYERIYNEVLLGGQFEEWIDRLVGGFNVSDEEKVQLLREVIPPEYIRGETERSITTIVDYLNNENDDLSVYIDLNQPLDNIRPAVLGFLDSRIDAMQRVPAATPQMLSSELKNFLLLLANGQIPPNAPTIEALSVEQWRQAYGAAFDSIASDPQVAESTKQAIEQHRGEVLESIAVGDVDTALKLSSHIVTNPLIDEAISGLMVNLDDQNRLDLVKEIAEDSQRPRDQVVNDANLMRFVLRAGTHQAALWTALGLMGLFTLLIAILFVPYWRHVFFWPSAMLFVFGGLLLVAGVFFLLDIPSWGFWICQNSDSPSCVLSLDVLRSMAFGFGVDFIQPSAIVVVIGCAGLLVSVIVGLFSRNRPRGEGVTV
jgi:hypothetical protein